MENMHIWMADAQSTEERQALIKTLDNIAALQPERVIAGHILGKAQANTSVIDFNKRYIQSFEQANSETSTADELIQKMKQAYPELHEVGTLEFSAKVVKGDIKWPQ
ncbi:hypothetical protein [Bacterioplanoides sp.]|uniref:hypothetical protein n=1 Tax=Bacterioplanoides sp. TaxID=2066072 RepID=UPI003B5C98D4